MEPDMLIVNDVNVIIDGQKIGNLTDVTIKVPTDERKDSPFSCNKSLECSFKLTRKSKRNLAIFFKLNFENVKLQKILYKTRKLRVKKKLAGRINRNVYELMKYGLA